MQRPPLDGIQGICSFSGAKARLLCGILLGGLVLTSARADDWPQWLGPNRDGVWRETGILEQFPKDGPKIRWRKAIGSGYAGPAVAAGRVYVTDRILAEVKCVVATSANLPGGPDPRRIEDIPRELLEQVAAVVDGGELRGTPSTVIDFTGAEPRVVREGAVPSADAIDRVAAALA